MSFRVIDIVKKIDNCPTCNTRLISSMYTEEEFREYILKNSEFDNIKDGFLTSLCQVCCVIYSITIKIRD